MLGTFGPPATLRWAARHRARVTARIGASACVAAACAAGLTGCAAPKAAGPPIQVGAAYVTQPGASDATDAYVMISNSGSSDRLLSVRSSAGGQVTLTGPSSQGATTMRAVRTIDIPADGTVRFDPDGFHLLITGSGPMRAGTEITLTLVFAKAGAVSVPTLVENPETGGASYLGD
jgi:periplasmic copper chaperone A